MLKTELHAWRTRSLADLDIVYLYLDALALRVRSAGKVVSVPVLGVVGVLADGHKQLLALELCGGESFEAWKGCLDDLVARGLAHWPQERVGGERLHLGIPEIAPVSRSH